MTFWKRQNYEDNKESRGFEGGGGGRMNRQSTEGF